RLLFSRFWQASHRFRTHIGNFFDSSQEPGTSLEFMPIDIISLIHLPKNEHCLHKVRIKMTVGFENARCQVLSDQMIGPRTSDNRSYEIRQ
ncbi:MAG: hypothetical protein LBF02_02100, partial [Mycoplasmataceae bacterium]|nr:hypothetical protein [Mycoplasmataceae bacterium]